MASLRLSPASKKFSRRALETTETLERLMAAAANMGLNVQPVRGIQAPAARGIPAAL